MIIHIYLIFLISYLSSYLSLRFMLWYSSFIKCCVHTKLAICNTYINSVSVFILTQELAPLRFIRFLLLIIIFVSFFLLFLIILKLYYYIIILLYITITILLLLYYYKLLYKLYYSQRYISVILVEAVFKLKSV